MKRRLDISYYKRVWPGDWLRWKWKINTCWQLRSIAEDEAEGKFSLEVRNQDSCLSSKKIRSSVASVLFPDVDVLKVIFGSKEMTKGNDVQQTSGPDVSQGRCGSWDVPITFSCHWFRLPNVWAISLVHQVTIIKLNQTESNNSASSRSLLILDEPVTKNLICQEKSKFHPAWLKIDFYRDWLLTALLYTDCWLMWSATAQLKVKPA